MSALTTRMLVLGVVKLFGPANGYQLRRELLSWRVEQWAALNPGSIYSMLSTLEKQGSITRHELSAVGDERAATVYTVTDAGDAEFHRLTVAALDSVPDSGDVLPLRVAANFAPLLSRQEFLAAMRTRAELLRDGLPKFAEAIAQLQADATVPPSVAIELQLERGLADAQLEWVDALIATVDGGGLYFRGEDDKVSWAPAPDDPGWRMFQEREGYRRRITAGGTPSRGA
ncbi:MAG TPA: PadR family transcriptional regulator [Pseudolysinimonas sp.]|jgi:DNA-binding PadR family transcriptional regulator